MSEDINRRAANDAYLLRAVTDDRGQVIGIAADSTPFGDWLRRPVVDDYGNEVTLLNCRTSQDSI
jgi:hypothetical protein